MSGLMSVKAFPVIERQATGKLDARLVALSIDLSAARESRERHSSLK